MRCPVCGLSQASHFQQCMTCGANLAGTPVLERDVPEHHRARRFKGDSAIARIRWPAPSLICVLVLALLTSFGATFFFVSRPPDDERLLRQGRRQLASGQYAFAVKTLEQAVRVRPGDARQYLILARAYIGVDEIDKAWQSIGKAQQLGCGLTKDPDLASDLANHYRQRGDFQKAADILRAMAVAGIPGKKAELADLDGLWGDECIHQDKLEQALTCWEEVRDLHEGIRYAEADNRLATIYQDMVNHFLVEKDEDQALSYLCKLNTISENRVNLERTAEIYEHRGQLDLAIGELRKALKAGGRDSSLERRLADILVRQGKLLMDKGDTAPGLAFLQEAGSLSKALKMPSAIVRKTSLSLVGQSGMFKGELWNPGAVPVNYATIKLVLFDPLDQKALWQEERPVIDEFVKPLYPNDTRSFEIAVPPIPGLQGRLELKLYLDGALYQTYPVDHTGFSHPVSQGATGGLQRPKPESAEGQPANLISPPLEPIQPKDLRKNLPPAEPEGREEPSEPGDRTLKDLE